MFALGLGLLALLVVGVSVTLTSVAGLARRLRGGQPHKVAVGDASPTVDSVAVLIPAHNAEHRIVGTLNSVARVVPLANVHVVSDDSTDRTVQLAREYGVQVVETFGRLGRAGAIESGIQAFRLADRFGFVVLVDVDTRLDPRHLERVLPRFADPAVVAVDVRADYDRATDGSARLLTAYRARAYALAQWQRVLKRSATPTSVARALPSVARTYRTTVLARIAVDAPAPVVEDFDATLRICRDRLGRVDFCADVGARPARPTRFAEYRRQTDQWFTGYWLALRRNRTPAGVLAAIELMVTGVVLALTPVALVVGGLAAAGVGPAWQVGLLSAAVTVLVADYALTVAVAAASRRPAQLVTGLAFPLLRLVDAVIAVRALARVWLGTPSAEWISLSRRGSDTVRPPSPRPSAVDRAARRLAGPLAVLGWPVVIGAAAVVVIRVAWTRAMLPPSGAEPALINFAYGQYAGQVEPMVGAELTLTSLQLRVYTAVTWAFERGPTVLAAARELSVVTAAAMMLGLVLVARLLRVRPLLIAVVLGLLAICGPVITVLTPVGPGTVAAAWLPIAAAAVVGATRASDFRWVTAGGIALLVALATAAILVIPIGVAVAGAVAAGGRRSHRRILGGLAVFGSTGVLAVLLWRAGVLLPAAATDALEPDQRIVVLGVVMAVALAGLVTGWLRPVAVGAGAGAGFAFAMGPAADALLPALVLAAAIMVVAVIEEAAGWQPDRAPVLARRLAAGLAAVVALATSIVGVTIRPRSWSPPDHSALAGWAAGNLDSGVTLVAPPAVWPDLHRDLSRRGLPDRRVREAAGSAMRPDELLVTVGPDRPAGIELARFGSTADGSPTLAVLSTHLDSGYLAPDRRMRAGTQLAANSRLRTTDQARGALRSGRVDLRAMALLAELCRDHEVTLAATANPAHEAASPMPHRIVVVSEVDGTPIADRSDVTALLGWIRAQQAPYAPAEVTVTPDGLTLRWRLPTRLDMSS